MATYDPNAIQNSLTSMYGSSDAAAAAIQRVKSGQGTAQDTMYLSKATGDPTAAASLMGTKTPGASTSVSTTTPGAATASPGSSVASGFTGTAPAASTPAATGNAPTTVATPKPTVATVDNPVVVRSGSTQPTSTQPTYPDDASRYYALAGQDPSTYTQQDISFLKTLQAKSSLMGGLGQALGTTGDIWTDPTGTKQRFSVNEDGSVSLTDPNGITRQATDQEKEALYRSPQGQSARLMSEAKQQAAQALKDRQAQDAALMKPWQQAVDAAHQQAMTELEKSGQERLQAMQNSFSTSGFGRSTVAAQKVGDVSKAVQDQLNTETQLYQAKVDAKAAEMQGLDAQAMKPYYDRINQLNEAVASATAQNFAAVQGLNAQANLSNQQSLQNLLSTFSTSALNDLKMAGFDKDESEKTGYFMKQKPDGTFTPMLDKNGEPIQFKKQSQVKASASINLPDGTIGTRVTYTDGHVETLDSQGNLLSTTNSIGSLAGEQPGKSGTGTVTAIPTSGFTPQLQLNRTGTVATDTNNPGNITADSIPSGFTKQSYGEYIGAIGTYKSSNGREYFVFPSQESGMQALQNDIIAKQSGETSVSALKNSDATLADYLRAHTGTTQSATGSYAQAVMDATGATMTTPFRSIDPSKLSQGIAKAEGWSGAPTDKYSQPFQNAAMEQAAQNLALDSKFKIPKGMNTIDITARANAIKKGNVDEALQSEGIDTTGWTDSQRNAFKGLTTQDINAAVAFSRADPNALSAYSTRNNVKASIVAAGQAINPKIKAGSQTWISNSWVNPNSSIAKSNQAISTAVLHFKELQDAADALKNKNIPAYNSAMNSVLSFFGIPDKGNFELNATAVGDELAKAYGADSQSDREEMKKAFSSNLSPAQFNGVLDKAAQLMLGKLSSNAHAYKYNVGIKPAAESFGLDQQSIDWLKSHEGKLKVDSLIDTGDGNTEEDTTAPSSTSPSSGSTSPSGLDYHKYE